MIHDPFRVTVQADRDSWGEALPCRFRLGEHEVEVAEILDRWPGQGHLYVKLRGSDGATYVLRQDLDGGEWQLVLFRDRRIDDQAPGKPQTNPSTAA